MMTTRLTTPAEYKNTFCYLKKKKLDGKTKTVWMNFLPQTITAEQVPLVTMYGQDFRKEVAVMYNAAFQHNCAQELAKCPADLVFMLSSTDWMEKISQDPNVLQCGHSGATEAMCFRYVRALLTGALELLPPATNS